MLAEHNKRLKGAKRGGGAGGSKKQQPAAAAAKQCKARPSKAGEEDFDDLQQLLLMHNASIKSKRSVPQPAAAAPRVREVKAWERRSGKVYGELGKEERERADKEIVTERQGARK
mmetsp:Transcript_16730/g.33368  ORF Transcript_16730/g.33368 Transcript_16730/m.33368 type:complete len:115 (+) Transcript_16730:959-1303(+)